MIKIIPSITIATDHRFLLICVRVDKYKRSIFVPIFIKFHAAVQKLWVVEFEFERHKKRKIAKSALSRLHYESVTIHILPRPQHLVIEIGYLAPISMWLSFASCARTFYWKVKWNSYLLYHFLHRTHASQAATVVNIDAQHNDVRETYSVWAVHQQVRYNSTIKCKSSLPYNIQPIRHCCLVH